MSLKQLRSDSEVMNDLNQLLSAANYIEVLGEIIIRDFTGTAEKVAAADPQETISYNEFGMLIGIWIKNRLRTESPNDPYILLGQTDDLAKEYHDSLFFNHLPNHDTGKSMFEAFENGALFKEAFFYSSTAGYDRQYIEILTQKYAYDKVWLKQHKAIELDELPGFFQNITLLINHRIQLNRSLGKKLNSKEKVKLFTFSRKELLSDFPNANAVLEALTIPIIGEVNQDYNDIADFNIFNERPIIEIGTDQFFIPSPYHVAEALYESPYYWMFADESYRAIAAKHRGLAAEDLVFKYISKFFGRSLTFRNVKIKHNRTRTLTDIDVIAYTEDSAVIFQIKSKKLTLLSRKGNLDAIKSDFKRAVRIAKDQADQCIEALKNADDYIFEQENGTPFLPLEVSNYETVIVLLDQYPAISHQTHILFGDELDTTPIAFSIFDLEALLRYLKTPERFADYINRRTLYSKKYRAANELQYLALYLDRGIEEPGENEYVYIDPQYGQLMDSDQQQRNIDEIKGHLHTKTGRNDPCPCGSGKKFKKCHG